MARKSTIRNSGKSRGWAIHCSIDFSLQACQSHREIGMFSASFGFVQPTSNYKGSWAITNQQEPLECSERKPKQ